VEYLFIGDADLATAFRFVGVPGVSATTPKIAAAAFRAATEGGSGLDVTLDGGDAIPSPEELKVLILTEQVADALGEAVVEWQLSGRFPLIVEVPGLAGHLEGRKSLVEAIRDAIGIRV